MKSREVTRTAAALCMAFALALPTALAAGTPGAPDPPDLVDMKEIEGVSVSWGDLSFVYHAAESDSFWETESPEGNRITVENFSERVIQPCYQFREGVREDGAPILGGVEARLYETAEEAAGAGRRLDAAGGGLEITREAGEYAPGGVLPANGGTETRYVMFVSRPDMTAFSLNEFRQIGTLSIMLRILPENAEDAALTETEEPTPTFSAKFVLEEEPPVREFSEFPAESLTEPEDAPERTDHREDVPERTADAAPKRTRESVPEAGEEGETVPEAVEDAVEDTEGVPEAAEREDAPEKTGNAEDDAETAEDDRERKPEAAVVEDTERMPEAAVMEDTERMPGAAVVEDTERMPEAIEDVGSIPEAGREPGGVSEIAGDRGSVSETPESETPESMEADAVQETRPVEIIAEAPAAGAAEGETVGRNAESE